VDPNANLNEQIEIAQRMSEGKERTGDASRLADLVLALDDWMRRGGFVPRRWEWWKDQGGGPSR
jgi:D-alanyl-D-alanine dipeptidase